MRAREAPRRADPDERDVLRSVSPWDSETVMWSTGSATAVGSESGWESWAARMSGCSSACSMG
jgi:hypothetical protein